MMACTASFRPKKRKKGLKKVVISLIMLSLMVNLGFSWSWDNAVSIYEPSANGSLIDLAPAHYLGTLTSSGAYMDNQPKVSPMSAIGFGYFKNDSEAMWNGLEPFSVSIWVQYNGTSTGVERLWSMGDNGEQHVALVGRDGSNGQVQFYIHGFGDPNVIIYPTINVGDWFLLTAVMDGTNNHIYFNDGLTNASAGSVSHNQFTHVDIGTNYDESYSAVHYSINQIIFWNKSLIQSEIADLYNNGAGRLYFSDYLNLTYLSPANLNETVTHNINFSVIPTAKNNYTGCVLKISNSSTSFNYNNISEVINNSAVNWMETLANGTYNFNFSCSTITLTKITDNYALNINIPAYIPVIYDNCTITVLPTEAWTLQYCLSNTTLYREKVYSSGGLNCNYSETPDCPDGCSIDKCNPTVYESWIGNLELFAGVLIAFALILYVGKKSRGIRF